MAKIKGVCKNIDEDCSKALGREIQEIERSAPFVCVECNKPLLEQKGAGGKKEGEKGKIPGWLIAAIAAVLVVGLGFGAYKLFFQGDTEAIPVPPEPEPTTIMVSSVSLNQSTLTLKVNQSITLTATTLPEDAADKNVQWSSGDESVATVTNGVVTAIKAGIVVVTVKSVDGSNKTAECTITVESDSSPTPPPPERYAFGRYEGSRVNGIPDGQGTMYYTCRVQIAKHGRNKYYAEEGDTFVGTWGNGDIVNGNLYDRNNNQKAAILAGKRPNPYNLSNDRCE